MLGIAVGVVAVLVTAGLLVRGAGDAAIGPGLGGISCLLSGLGLISNARARKRT